ncbi:MAG: TetR/AcrR family transcriptional regulator [Treponema sp.]|jgi:AcrR family transcriptional regulator|nr:TetR/AcrR family transcriptional regulator [Treponema sp.]MBQ2234574.1 TetR/AcrR family transcriptional regulator [Treponema sp.]MBQ5647140.1 TetR/AcrR family transcriptional regulator [Treponema sp.]MBQ5848730.1 TetR/AcrR family transcriptional regulator [Treponema sp.]MBQ5876526.1 TetR/AcrR family transcriptional regulator [Treponema sp.]
MATIVEHEKRKHEILQKALDVFMEEGYEDVTFQKIADRCGITRTTLYIYFKNKREIFIWSIKQLTAGIEVQLMEFIQNKELNASDCLRKMMFLVLDECKENHKLFNVVLSYLLTLQKSGINPAERVRRRVIRLRHLISLLIIRGNNSNEFNNVNIKDTNELLYGLIESAIFRIAVLGQSSIDEVYGAIDLAINKLKK